MIISDDVPMQEIHNESNYSVPVTSPYQTTARGEYDQSSTYSSMGTDPASLWVSPDMILDSSKQYSQGGGSFGYCPQSDFQNSTSWQTYNQCEISPTSSNSNFREEAETSEDFSQYRCMSPYSVHGSYMGYYGNEDVLYEGFDLPNSLKNPKPF
ncbi:hypothetical protein ACH5RR_040481 [Cinchona calisaya]|uniref:Uncharacterized protein n=1 Tax=Cinchona calisaya TaxID=153742 RepID=A0ABD2XX16_9GENT